VGPSGVRDCNAAVRTQSREAVSQALDRIRPAVTGNKEERLTALLHLSKPGRAAIAAPARLIEATIIPAMI
jgi:hypothetical protein